MRCLVIVLPVVIALVHLPWAAMASADVVFHTGFEYASGNPTVGTDPANLNGADGQVGSWSGTLGVGTTGDGGTEAATFVDSSGDTRLLFDRPSEPSTLLAELDYRVELDGATVDFEYNTRRTGGHVKDVDIVGLDRSGNESFHLVVATTGTNAPVGEKDRLGLMTDDGATLIWDLPTVSGNDADDDLPWTGGDGGTMASISLSLLPDGFTVNFQRGSRAWESDVLGYNGAATTLASIAFTGNGNDEGNEASGFFLDDVHVEGTIVPEPSSVSLLGLGLLGLLGFSGRRRRR